MLDLNSIRSEDERVTDPEELRNRAASIFERLRTSGAASSRAQPDPGEPEAGTDAAGGQGGGGDQGVADPSDPESPQPSAAHDEDADLTADADPDRRATVTDGHAHDENLPSAAVGSDESAAVTGTQARNDDHPAATVPAPTAGRQPSGSDEGPDPDGSRPAPVDAGGAEGRPDERPLGLPGADALGPLEPPLGPPVGSQPTRPDSPAVAAPAITPTRRPLPRRLAIANQKGGVGKTTTAVNLGAALAELGYRVLVVDLDPQGNATTGLGINARNLDASVYDVILHDVPVEDCIEPSSLRNLFVVPATIDLAGAEIELVPVFSRELRLRRALERLGDDFDFTLIDCPPSLGLLTVNGLAAAGEVVVPIQCEYYALEGLGQLLRNVNLVQTNLNPTLEVSTIILTMYDARTRLAEQVVAEVRKHFGDRVCRSVVPRTVRLSEAPSFGQPIIVFDSSSRGAIAYRELAKEVSGGSPQRVG
jgi:chromosome partitioning protein